MSTPLHQGEGEIPTRVPPPPPSSASSPSRSPRHGDNHNKAPQLSIVNEEGNDSERSSSPVDDMGSTPRAGTGSGGYHRRDVSDLTQNDSSEQETHSSAPSDLLTLSEKEAAKAAVKRFTQNFGKSPKMSAHTDNRITMEDLSPTMDQQVEAALVDAMERTEKQQKKKVELLKSVHRRNRSSMGESARVLENITEDAVQLFLNHPTTPATEQSSTSTPDATSRRKHSDASDDSTSRHSNGHNKHATKPQNSRMPDADIVPNAHQGVPAVFRASAEDIETSSPRSVKSHPRPVPSPRANSGRKGFASLVQDMQQAQSGKLHSLEKYKSSRTMGLMKSYTKDSADNNSVSESRTSKQSGAAANTKSERSHDKKSSSAIKGGGLGGNVSDTDLFYQNAAMMFNIKKDGADDGLFASHDSENQNNGLRQRVPGNAPQKKAGWATLKGAVALGAVRSSSNDNEDGMPMARVASSHLKETMDIETAQGLDGGGDWNHDDDNVGNTQQPSGGRKSQRPGARKSKGRCGVRQYLRFIRLRGHQVFQFRSNVWKWLKASRYIITFIGIPLIGTAALLYYGLGNPLTTRAGGSASWWLILAFRWVLTLVLSKIFQYILLDCIALRSSFALNTLGPITTLTLVQSRGWPFELVFWCILNFGMLYGRSEFVKHWLFYQPYIAMFNANNQAGTFLTNKAYLSVLVAGIVIGILTSVKRTAVSLFLGRRTCEFYGPQLEKIMEKLILVTAVAQLAKEIEMEHIIAEADHADDFGHLSKAASPFYVMEKTMFHTKRGRANSDMLNDEDSFDGSMGSDVDDDDSRSKEDSNVTQQNNFDEKGPPDIARRNLTKNGPSRVSVGTTSSKHAERTKKILSSQRGKMMRLLDTWEEPVNLTDSDSHDEVSIKEILQFRHALGQINTTYPFSRAYGVSNDRKSCIDSAQEVYKRLILHTPDVPLLPFETISIVGLDEYGDLDEQKTKQLVKLFRPDVNGNLCMLDFVKSCDEVYRRFRTFRAAVANSSIVNNAYERIIDGLFYFFMAILVLLIFKIDVWTLLVSVSSLVVSFAFAFGSAVSKFTEGVLLVTVRKPFDIGDRIHVSNPDTDTAPDGTSAWYVENISLFATTLRFATTNEVATIANGNLANSRIVNAARSPRMLCYAYMKFGIDVSYEKVQFFRETLESFIKARPREWISLCGFRLTKLHADLGYVEYVIVLQHRESWQNIVAMLNSKAEVQSFCLEVSKKLNMRYVAPPLPVELGFDEDAQMPPWMNNMMGPTTMASSMMGSPLAGPSMVGAQHQLTHPLHPHPSEERSPRHKKVNTMDDSVAAVKTVQEMFRKKQEKTKKK